MNRYIKWILTATICLSLTSCDWPERVKFRSFVQSYYKLNGIEAKGIKGYIYVYSAEAEDASVTGAPYEPVDYKTYDSLCTAYGDTSFNKSASMDKGEPLFINMFCTSIERIEVECLTDYDEKHPAGSSANDMLRFISSSPIRFIRSHYKSTYNWAKSPGLSETYSGTSWAHDLRQERAKKFNKGFHPIDMMLDRMTADDFTLIGNGWLKPIFCLGFETMPAETGTHSFNVKIFTTDGREMSSTTKVILF